MLDRKIREAVQQLAGTQFQEQIFVLPATVNAVSIANRTCDVIPVVGKADTPITGVKLMAEIEDGLLIVPVLNSTVFIAYSRTTPAFVIQFSAIDYVIWWVGGSSIEIKNNGAVNINSQAYPGTVTFNGGSNGGMVNVLSLVTKLNNLENLLNDLIAKFNAHTHVLTLSTGTGTAAPTVTTEPGTIGVVTKRSDLEDVNVNH